MRAHWFLYLFSSQYNKKGQHIVSINSTSMQSNWPGQVNENCHLIVFYFGPQMKMTLITLLQFLFEESEFSIPVLQVVLPVLNRHLLILRFPVAHT